MKYLIISIICSSLFALFSCTGYSTDAAEDWSSNIKGKIIEDASRQPDNVQLDSATYKLTLYKGDQKLRVFQLKPKVGNNGQLLSVDTASAIFYSADQTFELVRELCPISEKSFEGIRYKGEAIGLAEFRYCNGKIQERGFRFIGDVGIWREYDPSGKMVRETDHGNIQALEQLKNIKYFR